MECLPFSDLRIFSLYIYIYIYIYVYIFLLGKGKLFFFCNSDCASSLLAVEVCLRTSSEVLPLAYVARVINKKKTQSDFD